MLSRLLVRNYVLIDSLEIDFPEGLIIITGQTGAGKSILLGALSLVTGAKADASMVSEGADNCVVEAEFDAPGDEIRSILEENDVECEDGNIIVRRVVNRSGRSRAFVNDCPVPVQTLAEIAVRLVDIHSQHQTLLLTDKRFQMRLLDNFAGNDDVLDRCGTIWQELSSKRTEFKSLEEKIARMQGEKDYNEAQYRQLETACIRPGELSELEQEQRQLANAEEIKISLSGVEELFSPSSDENIPSIDASLKESSKLLIRLSKYLPMASGLSERVDACRRELDDILSEVSSLNSSTDVSEQRLEEVEARMSMLYGLMKKHSCSTEEELAAIRDGLSAELCDSSLIEERRDSLAEEIGRLERAMNDAAEELHQAREAAAMPFAKELEETVRSLELPYSVFEVELSDAICSASGRDSITFRFSASGKNPADIAKCASGGELSRIMLALKAMGARYANMPTMIFDEIDTGVSGSVADKMGSVICEMGNRMQVFAITHLPQVAAKGSAHYLVSKEIDSSSSKAVSTITRLDRNQRVLEVARMLSGSTLTEAAIANAESLLSI